MAMAKTTVDFISPNKNWFKELLCRVGVNSENLNKLPPYILKKIDDGDTDDISSEELTTILEFTAKLTANDNIGLALAKKTNLQDVGLYGHILLNATDIEDFLTKAAKYYPLIYQPGRLELNIKKDTTSFYYRDIIPAKYASHHDNVWSVAFYLLQVLSKLPANFEPNQITFSHGEQYSSLQLKEELGRNIIFDQADNGFEIPTNILKTPFKPDSDHIVEVFESIANNLLNNIKKKQCLETQIKLLIFSNLSNGSVSLKNISTVLNISESTLKRRLRKEGKSFSEIFDEVKIYVAKQLLSTTNMTIKVISDNLGYSEHSAFNHFFYRLMKLSPKEYRKKSNVS